MAKLSTGATKRLVDSILMKIAQGRAIADGMMGWLPQHIVELIRAGEQGGTLAQNMKVAAESLGTKNETVSSLLSSLTYPLVVLIAGLAVLVYMNHSIFPQFESIKPMAQWPEQGKNLGYYCQFCSRLVVDGCRGDRGGLILISRTLNDYTGTLRKTIDTLPLISLYREITAARFMETLGLLISNGVVFKQALKILQMQASPYLAWHLVMMEHKLGKGRSNIAEVLDTNLVSDADVLRLRAIAEAKGFEHALVRLGRQAADRGVQTVRKNYFWGCFTGHRSKSCGVYGDGDLYGGVVIELRFVVK